MYDIPFIFFFFFLDFRKAFFFSPSFFFFFGSPTSPSLCPCPFDLKRSRSESFPLLPFYSSFFFFLFILFFSIQFFFLLPFFFYPPLCVLSAFLLSVSPPQLPPLTLPASTEKKKTPSPSLAEKVKEEGTHLSLPSPAVP